MNIFQTAIELVCQDRAELTGETYNDIVWSDGTPLYTEEELIQAYKEKVRNLTVWQEFLQERNKRLSETDWTQSRDVSLANDADWITYRQALRDLPETADPWLNGEDSINWPTKPE